MGGQKSCQSRRPNGRAESNDENNDGRNFAAETEADNEKLINKEKLKYRILQFRNVRKAHKNCDLIIIKTPQNVFQALHLPKVLNLNPRSAMNKIQEIKTFIEEVEIDVTFISESHDRENKKLEDHMNLPMHQIISNIYQRPTKEPGGRPALIVNTNKYTVEDLTNTKVNIPWGVEATWALLTPKKISKDSIVKRIVLCAIYVKLKSRKKTATLNHIAEV